MILTAAQLVAHGIGDYVFQSDWMAASKTQKSVAALAHVTTYTLAFVPLACTWTDLSLSPTTWIPASVGWLALLFILVTHFVIDRWRLARYVCWAKNWLAPKWLTMPMSGAEGELPPKPLRNWPWESCVGTGYGPDKQPWMAVWLMIITDNLLHVLCNSIALTWL